MQEPDRTVPVVSDQPGIFTVIHQDGDLVVLNKCPGVLVIAAPGRSEPVLLDALPGLHPCHRLDMDTSGLIVFARSKARQKTMMELFHVHALDKIYLAVCNGSLGHAGGRFNRSIEGQAALTEYRVIAVREGLSVVLVRLHTGRTNQIRLHFSQAGFPLLGDDRFGRRKDFARPFGRTALHALRLRFRHPWTGEDRQFFAPLPPDLAGLLDGLGVAVPRD